MKQTKSALTMLLAHYRAIYKHAILAAFVAASTLGVANAATPIKDVDFSTEEGLKFLNETKTEINLTGSDEFIFTEAFKKIPDTVTSIKVSGGTVTFDGQQNSTAADLVTAIDKNFSLDSGSTLNISIANSTTNTTKLTLGNANKSTSVSLNGTINVAEKGTLELTTGTTTDKTTILDLTGANINNAGKIDFGDVNADLSVVGSLTVAGTPGANAVITGKNITIDSTNLLGYLKKDGKDTKGNIAIKENGKLTIKNATDENSLDLSGILGKADVDGKISLGTTATTIIGDKLSVTAKLESANIDNVGTLSIKAGQLTIGDGQTDIDASMGFAGATVSDALTFNGTSAGVDIQDVYNFAANDTNEHTITSANKLKLDTASKGFNFQQGNWKIDSDVDLGGTAAAKFDVIGTQNKTVSVSLAEGKKLKVDTDGVLNVSGIQGNKGTLNLVQGTVDNTGAGEVSIGAYGELIATSGNFANIFTAGKLTVAGNGSIILKKADGSYDDLEIKESSFGSATTKVGLAGSLKGNNLTVTDGATDGIVLDNATNGIAETTVLEFNNVTLKSGQASDATASFDKGTINVANSISVTNKTGDSFGALTLGTTNASKLNLQNNTNGKLSVSKLELKNGSKLSVDGTWTLDDKASEIKLTTAADGIVIKNNSSLKTNAKLTTAGTLEITGANSSAEFKSLDVTGASKVNGGGKLIINGDGDTTKPNLSLNGILTVSNDSSLVLKNDVLDEVISGTGKDAKVETTVVSKISTTDNSEVVLDYAKGTKLSKELVAKLSQGFKASGTFNGFINLGGAELDGTLTVENNHFKWADYKDLANVNVTSESLKNAVADTTKTEAKAGVYGSVGAVNVTEALGKADKFTFAGSTVLSNAKANGGKFVSATGSDKALDVTVTDNSNLSLHNGGEIGAITLGAQNSNLVVKGGDTVVNGGITGAASEASFIGTKTTVKDAVNVQSIDLEQANVVLAKQATVAKFDADKGSNLNAQKIQVTLAATSPVSNIAGSTVSVKNLTFADATNGGANLTNKQSVLDIKDNGTLVVEGTTGDINGSDGKLVLASTSNGEIQIGEYKKGADNAVTGSNGTMFVRDSSGLTSVVNVTSGTEKASFAIFANEIKPAEILPSEPVPGAQSASIMTLGVKTGASVPPAGANPDNGLTPPGSTDGVKDPTPYTLQHKDIVGANSAVAYGYNSIDELMSDMKTNNLITEKGGIKDGRAVAVVNAETKLVDAAAGTGKGSIVLGDTTAASVDGNINLGDKSAIIVTDNAFGFNNDKTALTVLANGVQIDKNADTKVILTGAFTSGDQRQVFNTGALKDGETLDLETATGMLVGKIGADGKVKLEFNDKFNSSAVFNKASTPVRDYLVGMGKGEVKDVITDKALAKKDEMTQFTQGLTTALDGGQTLEQAARFAVYGGSIKAAELATKSGSDAIKSYASANANVATAQTDMGSFFVVPTYKTSDSDSFNAEGLDFGSDINLSGVALGADFVVAPAVKLGAMFNIGTGDAKGQGAAEGIESDLDYVGGGFFVNYNQDNINVVADITYTQSSADMTGNVTAQGKYNQMKAEADTKALSLGVQGEYKVDLDTSYAIPYAGVRITKYDMDGYTVQLDGNDFITNNFDSMTVLSVPVGVKLGTEIVSGDWSLAPSLDLGVTFNLGDTDLSHSAKAVSKVQGMTLSTEVIDDVVFGIKGGLKANYQSLSLGLGLGYEMGSNSDDLSVQGTVKYTF